MKEGTSYHKYKDGTSQEIVRIEMSPRSAVRQLLTRAAIGFGALFVVGVVLAAIPNHRQPVMTQDSAAGVSVSQEGQQQGQGEEMEHSKMPGMSMDADSDDAKSSEPGAKHDMAHMYHGDTPHIHMTAPRPQPAALLPPSPKR